MYFMIPLSDTLLVSDYSLSTFVLMTRSYLLFENIFVMLMF